MSNAESTSGMGGRWSADDRDPAEIERDLDATRADLRATLEALEKRLSVDRLVEMTVGRVKERGGQFAGNLGEAIAENPMAIVLASVGLGWMMIDRRRGNARRHSGNGLDSTMGSACVGSAMGAMSDRVHSMSDRVHDAMASSRDTMAEAMASSRDTMAHARDSIYRARDSMSEAASTARHGIEQAHVSFDRMLEEQPLVLGAVGLAAGALIGALLPASETESRWLGEARDSAVRGAATAVSERVRAMQSTDHEDEDSLDDNDGRDGPEDRSDGSEEHASRAASERGAGRPAGQTH